MYWPMIVYILSTLVIVAGMEITSFFLGERQHDRMKGEPYESGIKPTGSARIRMGVRFYLVALFFVVFDVESIFIFAWAIAFRQTGWAGYIEILIFIGILMLTLVYLWRMGTLDWGARGTRKRWGY